MKFLSVSFANGFVESPVVLRKDCKVLALPGDPGHSAGKMCVREWRARRHTMKVVPPLSQQKSVLPGGCTL